MKVAVLEHIENESARSYRKAMAVTKIIMFKHGDCYPACPRCNLTLEREYQTYCDRCGQHLSWKNYKNALVVTFELF